MRRFHLIGLLALALAACSSNPPQPTPGGPPTLQATLEIPPTADPAVIATATALASGPLNWQAVIVQSNQALVADANGQVALARAPFTLRVTLPQVYPVKLNANTSDQNFQTLNPGFVFVPDCTQAFCTGMEIAEELFGASQALVVGQLETHYLYYASDADHRWSRVQFTDTGVVLERDVAYLNDTPLAQFADPALYLTLFVNYRNPEQIDDTELQKITLLFQ